MTVYAAETWKLTKLGLQEKKLVTFEKKVLKIIYELFKEEKKEAQQRRKGPISRAEATTRKLKWDGHVSTREEGSTLKEVCRIRQEKPLTRW